MRFSARSKSYAGHNCHANFLQDIISELGRVAPQRHTILDAREDKIRRLGDLVIKDMGEGIEL